MTERFDTSPLQVKSQRRFSQLISFLGSFGGEFLYAVVLAWVVELLFAISSQRWLSWSDGLLGTLRTFAIIWFASAAAFFAGTMMGFVFGFPKTRSLPPRLATNPSDLSIPTTRSDYGDNTNLEEVSDWLTKIIVGLGLVEFRHIYNAVAEVGLAVSRATDNNIGAGVVAIFSMLYGFVCGFLYYYIWARLRLFNEFERRRNEIAQSI